MIDTFSGRSLRVSRDGLAGPYLILPYGQLSVVQEMLKRAGISFWVDENAISMSGGPVQSVINFSKHADADQIQRVLDQAK
jgi:hypothetical protein